jgi:hypothetical protein
MPTRIVVRGLAMQLREFHVIAEPTVYRLGLRRRHHRWNCGTFTTGWFEHIRAKARLFVLPCSRKKQYMHYAREAMVYAAGKNGEGSNCLLAMAHCWTVRKSSVSRSASMTRY